MSEAQDPWAQRLIDQVAQGMEALAVTPEEVSEWERDLLERLS